MSLLKCFYDPNGNFPKDANIAHITSPQGVNACEVNANIVNVSDHYQVDGVRVVTTQGAVVADAAGGMVIDVEARAAINALLARLRTSTGHGLIAG